MHFFCLNKFSHVTKFVLGHSQNPNEPKTSGGRIFFVAVSSQVLCSYLIHDSSLFNMADTMWQSIDAFKRFVRIEETGKQTSVNISCRDIWIWHLITHLLHYNVWCTQFIHAQINIVYTHIYIDRYIYIYTYTWNKWRWSNQYLNISGKTGTCPAMCLE